MADGVGTSRTRLGSPATFAASVLGMWRRGTHFEANFFFRLQHIAQAQLSVMISVDRLLFLRHLQ